MKLILLPELLVCLCSKSTVVGEEEGGMQGEKLSHKNASQEQRNLPHGSQLAETTA